MSSWKLNQIKPVWPTGPADPFRSFDLKARIADQPCSWNPLAAVGAAWGLPGFANVLKLDSEQSSMCRSSAASLVGQLPESLEVLGPASEELGGSGVCACISRVEVSWVETVAQLVVLPHDDRNHNGHLECSHKESCKKDTDCMQV